jgi:hypothetical protein
MSQDPYANDPDYLATDLESKFPPPFFPPHEKSRFHPYSARWTRPAPNEPKKEAKPMFRVDKQVPHVQIIGWISRKWDEFGQDDLLITTGKLNFTDYNEFSMEELVEALLSERV